MRATIYAVFALALLLPGKCGAQPGKHKDELSWDRNIGGLVKRYCLSCHNSDRTRGDVNLARDENPRQIRQHRKTWENARDMLEAEAMPPEKARQPSAKERKLLVRFLAKTLDELDCANVSDPGKPVVRRLNRVEYDLTIFDLTGLDLQLSGAFPPDASGYGFDNIGDVLTLGPVQVERYHTAARQLVAEIVRGAPSAAGGATEPQRMSYRRVFQAAEGHLPDSAAAARAVLRDFASRAFRRPVDDAYVDRLAAIVELARGRGQSFGQAVGHALTAILISPRFLLRAEQMQPETDQPYLVDAYDLASRLSYFLWSRPPDERLLQLAATGKLSESAAIAAEAKRMLADERSMALVDHFFGQWLDLRATEKHQPDRDVFPEFDAALKRAIQEEVRYFLAEVVRQDLPITRVIDADFAYVNERLAKFYGLKAVSGDAMQRVALPNRRRGGLLTSAALLMTQSDPQRVNVPRRGNFIAGRILGASPPPPPPDVPALDEASADGKRTLRERLELHRKNPQCASCHQRIDPLGFGLQNFDAIGRWQDSEAGKPIDASGTLADGRAFSGPEQLKDLLLKERAAFAATLAENLLIYALGRGPGDADRCVIKDMLQAAEGQEDRFSSYIVAIVTSYPFRYRRNPDS